MYKKYIFYYIFCLMFSFLFIACGGGGGGGGDGGDSADSAPVASSTTNSSSTTATLAPTCSVDSADASATGGDILCYQIDEGDLVQVAVGYDDTAIYAFYLAGDSNTKIGIQLGEERDALELIFVGQATGTHALARFSSFTRHDLSESLWVGNTAGGGTITLETYGEVGERIRGTFEVTLCGYNSNVHQVQCALGERSFRGSFDITREQDDAGTVQTPFREQGNAVQSL